MLRLYKQIGETPLECIERFRAENPMQKDAVLSYAGRLDPMAEGLLLVLEGEENNRRDEFLGLPKTYEFEILFGFSTDTYDLLGIAEKDKKNEGKKIFANEIEKILPKFTGKIIQKYPAFSSKPVNGKPLHEWAREGKIGEIEIPTNEIEIFNIEIIGEREIQSQDLSKEIQEKIKLVHGDFRQQEISTKWQEIFSKILPETKFQVFKLKADVSSGTYVRVIVNEIGKELGIFTVANSIKRTKAGEFEI